MASRFDEGNGGSGVFRAAQDWVSRLVQTTQDAVITIDAAGRVVLFNAAAERMFGYSWTEIRGEDLKILMPQRYAKEHDGYIERYERTGEAHAIGRIRVVTGKRRNGEEFPCELSVTEVPGAEESRYGAFIRDISEKVRLQKELVDSERLAAIGTTAAKFAHEVSNPLNGMYTQAQLLRRRLDRAEAVDDRLESGVNLLLRDIERLNGLLNEFRSMSRRQEYRFQPTSLQSICDEVNEAERLDFVAHNVEVKIELPDDLPLVAADPPKLKQVLLNLCKNAVEAMGDGGRITVSAEATPDRVALIVRDTGPGIPSDLDIFAPFATTKPEGTGLGLPIVREIVNAHGGVITYSSEPEQGSSFRLELPVAVDG